MSESPYNYKRYNTFGDTRPTKDQLTVILDQTPKDSLSNVFLRSEVYLDLATVDPRNHIQWLKKSRLSQGHVENIARTEWNKSKGSQERLSFQFHFLVANRLRRGEMPNWARAAQGKPLEDNYELLLASAESTLPLLRPGVSEHDSARTKLIEFIPVLLGARRAYKKNGEGWLGRLALNREESRPDLPASDINPNWDTGIMFENSAQEFLVPDIRLAVRAQFKRKPNERQRDVQSYSNAGVLPISAMYYGFRDPQPIVVSCLHEFGSIPAHTYEDINLLSSDQLEDVTESLHEDFRRHHESDARKIRNEELPLYLPPID